MKNVLCFFHLHSWEFKKEKHFVSNHPDHRETIRVLVRKCSRCGERQSHKLPIINNVLGSWIKCEFEENQVINLKS